MSLLGHVSKIVSILLSKLSIVPILTHHCATEQPIFNSVLLPQVQPGLGLSETWYSWIVSVASIGELLGAVTVGVLARSFYTKHLVLALLAMAFSGGIIYGIGKFGWMLLIGTCGVNTSHLPHLSLPSEL